MAITHVQTKTYTEEDYYALGEDVRAELINGQFYNMAAPSRIHQKLLSILHAAIYNYIQSKDGSCEVYPAPFAVKLFGDDTNIVEPDISVICDPDKLTDRGCTGAPDWIIEIASPLNPRHDYITKLSLYSNAGVREYWIVDPKYKTIHVYSMDSDNFELIDYSFADTVKAGIYDDLYIDFSILRI
ncbi:MAG: Uma2 family endonuclease [Lachnospiraceae bacterium]|nr:Uma2 family endonuclease [Lachnospiraceae bacterium]